MSLFRQLVALCLVFAGVAVAAGAGRPVRVVSQTVGSDELLLALAEPGQIAALSHIAREAAFSAVAEEAGRHPQIDTAGDAESILKFGPTLVLFADYSRHELIEQVRRAGVKVLIFERYKTLDDAYANLRTLAAELGAEARAEAVIADCEARVRALRERLRGVRPVSVISPSTYGVIPGSETTFQDLCDYAAAENLAATLGRLRGHEPPPAEQMLTWPIERVVLAGTSLEEQLVIFRKLPPYQFLGAVREGRVVLIEPWQLSCVSHHRVNAYERLARALHPEVFP